MVKISLSHLVCCEQFESLDIFPVLVCAVSEQVLIVVEHLRKKKMFYLTTHSAHFIYNSLASETPVKEGVSFKTLRIQINTKTNVV